MHVDDDLLKKADPNLRKALEDATEQDGLRVILQLDSAKTKAAEPEPDPADFGSRQEYRRALIERRRQELDEDIGETRRSVEQLVDRLAGGKIARQVVVDGEAGQIIRSLQLPGVKSAHLDRDFRAIPPRPDP